MLTTPKDTIVVVGSRTVLDCSVVGMAVTDILIWWYTNEQIYQQIFVTFGGETESTPVPSSDRYEIVGQYNLVIKSASFDDAGTYICDITGHKNYSVELSVLGMSTHIKLILSNHCVACSTTSIFILITLCYKPVLWFDFPT